MKTINAYILLIFSCLFISNFSYSQKLKIDLNDKNSDRISPIVKDRITEFSLIIRQIVKEEKSAMEKKIAEVEEELKLEKITTDEANAKKESLAKVYSGIINERIHEIDFNLDDIIKRQVAFSIMNDEDPIENNNEEDIKRRYKIVNQINGYGSLGYMAFTERENKDLNKHEKFSSNLTLGLMYERQLSITSPLNFLAGGLFSWRTYRLDDDMKFNRDEDGNVGLVKSDKSLNKSKLRSAYILAPVGLKFNFSKIKQVNDNFAYRPKSKYYIAAFIYGGALLSSNNIIKGNDIRSRKKGNYNVNNFIYGTEVTVGLRYVNIFIRKDFSNYFKENTFDNRKMLQFGINFGL